MALLSTGTNLFKHLKPGIISAVYFPPQSVRNYAARKGTRARKQKKKQVAIAEKLAWSPERGQIRKSKELRKITRTIETNELSPIDNVYFASKYKTQAISLLDAVQNHRENFHPSMVDVPEALIEVSIELDLYDGKKSNIKNFTSLANIPHPWVDRSTKDILAFARTPELQEIALEKGAAAAGGVELINKIYKGEFSTSDFDYIVCHDNCFLELSLIRGLLKGKYPSIRDGSVGADMVAMIHKFRFGLEIECIGNQYKPDLAIIKTLIGSLKLSNEQIEKNFESILQVILAKRPKKADPFVTWIWCTSPNSHEKFKIDHEYYVNKLIEPEVKDVKGKKQAKA